MHYYLEALMIIFAPALQISLQKAGMPKNYARAVLLELETARV